MVNANDMKITRAISIRQPFVELILRGIKKYEYRSQPTNIRERVYLYASLTPSANTAAWKKIKKEASQLPTGYVVGSVEIVGCSGNLRDGYRYRLQNPKRLRTFKRPLNHPSPVFWIPKFK